MKKQVRNYLSSNSSALAGSKLFVLAVMKMVGQPTQRQDVAGKADSTLALLWIELHTIILPICKSKYLYSYHEKYSGFPCK